MPGPERQAIKRAGEAITQQRRPGARMKSNAASRMRQPSKEEKQIEERKKRAELVTRIKEPDEMTDEVKELDQASTKINAYARGLQMKRIPGEIRQKYIKKYKALTIAAERFSVISKDMTGLHNVSCDSWSKGAQYI